MTDRAHAHQIAGELLVSLSDPSSRTTYEEWLVELAREIGLMRSDRDLARLVVEMQDELIVKLRAEVERLELELADMGVLAIAIASGGAT